MASAFKFLTARTKQLELELTLWGVGWQRFLGVGPKKGKVRGKEVHFCLFVLLTFLLCVCVRSTLWAH